MNRDYEKLLDEFIEIESSKCLAGSGDDGFYVQQVRDYISKQRAFWIVFARFIDNKVHKRRKK